MPLLSMIERKNFDAFARAIVNYSAKRQHTILLWIAQHGVLEAMLIMHMNNCGGWGPEIMTEAAAAGHLHIVKFLNENRHEGCSPDALVRARDAGHTKVYEYLVQHYPLKEK